MGYHWISIREAMQKILKKDWVLPVTQRPYVWGDRYHFERGIYRLFDSLYRNYPIGTFLLWDTVESIPFRDFLQNFDPERPPARPVDQGAWSRPKCLIYDGQQRLQSLYSCLMHTFCERVLCFDLLFEPTPDNIDATGFAFADTTETLEPHRLRLITLYEDYRRAGRDGLSEFRRKLTRSLEYLGDDKLTVVEKNVYKLWKLFNDETNQICGYFTIPSDLSKIDVQEIFVRLNVGGVPPTQADLVFSMIHVDNHDFQSHVEDLASDIHAATHIDLTIYDILQVLYFIQYGNARVDLDRVRRGDVSALTRLLASADQPIRAFYKRFLHDEFGINSASLYRSQIALLPLLLYYHVREVKSIPTGDELLRLKQYFILSQLNDWSLQAILAEATRLIKSKTDLPLDDIVTKVKTTTRAAGVTEQRLLAMPTFALKVLLPKKSYTFIESRGRLNPELEHIFPRTPRDTDLPPGYEDGKLKLWNLQLAVPGDINGAKLNLMPREFFAERPDDLHNHYDFLPSVDVTAAIWHHHNVEEFWRKRRSLMLKALRELYKLDPASS